MSRPPGPDLTPPDLPGYRFVKLIGKGGNAQVYLYEQDLPRRQVAVKVLNESVQSEAARRRFITEANVTAGLQHRHIVQLFDAKVTGDGRPYLVMPYYPLPNLALRARRSHFSVAEVLRVGIQIGGAVETSHRAGVLHRDIKPQNILTDSYGEPALTDFGIATTKGDGPEGMSVPWSPPEILFGSGPGDQRCDVYSLGATLWHLLAGRSPFEYPGANVATPALMDRIERDPPPRTLRGDVPESLERLLRQALAKDPVARPQTAMELIHGLQSVEQELRLPVTQPALSAGQLPTDTADSGTLSREPGLTDATTQRRASGGPPGQPPWDGGYDATLTREPRTGGARLTTAAGYDPAGPGYPDAPWPAGAPGRPGRRAGAGSRRVLTFAGGVALLAAAAVVAVLSLSPGHSDPAAAPAGNVESVTSSVPATSSAAATSSVSAAAVTTGPAAPGHTPGVPTAGTGSQAAAAQQQPTRSAPGSSVRSSAQSAVTVKTSSTSPKAQPITTPTVTATANGTTITGSATAPTAVVTTVTSSAPPPPPASPAVAVSEGSSTTRGTGSCAGTVCYFFNVTATNFPAGTILSYTCADSGGVWWGPTSQTESGSTTTNGAGTANFETYCLHTNDGQTVTINVSGGGKSAAGSDKT